MWLDNIIGYFSPARGVSRLKSRKRIELYRKYDGATGGRRASGWKSSGSSANSEIRASLGILRNRSRELVRNNPYANRAINLVATNLVGKGILPRISHENKEREASISSLWKSWAGSTFCDFDGKHTLYGLQNLIVKAMAESGEVLIRKRTPTLEDGSPIPLKLQVLESDFLITNEFQKEESTGNQIIQGIEIDSNGKRIAYHLYESHPGNNGQNFAGLTSAFKTERVPAEEIIHLYRMDRPGQLRGVPWLASVMLRMKDFDEFEDAQLLRQKIAAAWSVFITDIQGGDDGLTDDEKIELGEKVEPGMIELLPPGRDVKFASPPGVQNYKEYTTTVLRAIAVGIGASYEALTGDLSEVNFSSARMGWQEFNRNLDTWRTGIVDPSFNSKSFDWFLDAAVIMGAQKDGVSASWTAPKREMIDPTKEIPAKIKSIRAGIETLSDVVRQYGGDSGEQFEEMARTNETIDALGLVLDSDPRKVWQSGRLQDSEDIEGGSEIEEE